MIINDNSFLLVLNFYLIHYKNQIFFIFFFKTIFSTKKINFQIY